MPNSLAFAALFAWPLVSIVLFATQSRERAIVWSLLLAYLLLPSNLSYDLPAVPAMNKTTLPNFVLLVLVAFSPRSNLSLWPRSGAGKFLIALMLVGPFMTVVTNPDPAPMGPNTIPGLTLYDSISFVAQSLLDIIPFLVARACLATRESQVLIVKSMMVFGLLYSIPMIIEMFLSPVFHIWVYGYFPHDMQQQARWGGWRPVVFLVHGLWVALFAFMATLAAAILLRSARDPGPEGHRQSGFIYLVCTGYLGVVLFFCKSLGSFIYGMFAVPLVVLGRTSLQMRIATLLALIIISYPILRGLNLIPIWSIVDFFFSVDPDRGFSLLYRVAQETMLLEHVADRPVFGWGGWGRNSVFDSLTGEELTVLDGYWVIVIGIKGWAGFFANFGLMVLPLIMLWRQMHRFPAHVLSPVTSGLCLMLSLNIADLLTNATLTPLTWMIAGSLLGYAEAIEKGALPVAERTPEKAPRRRRTVL